MRLVSLGLEDEEGDEEEVKKEAGEEEEIEMASEDIMDIGDVPPPTWSIDPYAPSSS